MSALVLIAEEATSTRSDKFTTTILYRKLGRKLVGRTNSVPWSSSPLKISAKFGDTQIKFILDIDAVISVTPVSAVNGNALTPTPV